MFTMTGYAHAICYFAKASVFPTVKHQGICLTVRNVHEKYANNTSFMRLHYI